MAGEAGGTDLMSLGEHCQEATCRQRDFLPFKCDCCHKVFCLEHRTYSAHRCPHADQGGDTTIICPLCARLVKIARGEDPNVVFDKHTRGECEPSNYARVNKKPRCPVPGCKERLNLVNTHVCKHCSVSVCLKHRFAEDHNCSQRKGEASRASKPILSQLLRFGNLWSEESNRISQSAKSPATGSTGKGIPKGSNPQASARQSQSVLRAQAAGQRQQDNGGRQESGQREECPICQKRFPDVVSLISHSQEHQASTAAEEVCPHCRANFASAVALVEHVERQHTDHKGCVVC